MGIAWLVTNLADTLAILGRVWVVGAVATRGTSTVPTGINDHERVFAAHSTSSSVKNGRRSWGLKSRDDIGMV